MLAVSLTSLWLIAALMALGLLLIIAEVFIPAGGVIGVFGGIVVIVSVVGAFMRGPVTGIVALVAGLALTPLAIAFAVKMLPRSPLGRGIVLGGRSGDTSASRAGGKLDLAETEDRSALIGRQAEVVRDLRPSGVVLLDGQRVEAVSEGAFIESGQQVEIVHIDGRTIVVAAVEGTEEPSA